MDHPDSENRGYGEKHPGSESRGYGEKHPDFESRGYGEMVASELGSGEILGSL